MKKALVILILAGLMLGGCLNINVRPDRDDDEHSYYSPNQSHAQPMVDMDVPGTRVRVDQGYSVHVDR